jgi:hypothetical protein
MFYDIRELENKIQYNRKTPQYYDLAKKFILSLPYPIIIFIDPNNIELEEIINNERSKLKDITHIYKIKLEDTYYYRYLNKIKDLQSIFTIINGDINHETPLYITLTNNKFFFMEKSIEVNKFDSTHFIWLDFGINHVALNTENIHEWILNIPDKITQLSIQPFKKDESYKDTFRFIYHHTAGGLFTGSSENLLKYCHLFKKKTEEIYNEDWYQLEEAVMTIIQYENPDLFNFYYGDYQGIISNYLYPVNNIDLILNMCAKHMNNNNLQKIYEIVKYSYSFVYNNMNSIYIYQFISLHIVVDFYFNNKQLLSYIIYIINKKILEKDKNIFDLLKKNDSNISFYKNKNLILKI